MRAISDIIRLLILILLIPVVLILIGPLLVLAALRGQQSMGPITWETSRYNTVGRLGVLALGLALWLLVWSSLAWLLLANASFEPVLAQFLPPTTAPELVAGATSPPGTPVERTPASPPLTPTLPAPSTSAELSVTATLTSPTMTPLSEEGTALSLAAEAKPEETTTPEPSPTPTATRPTATPTLTPTSTVTPTPRVTPTPTLTPTPQPTPTFAERQVALAAVKDANRLLREAIARDNNESIDKLGVVWRGKALTVIENFATDLSQRYTRPVTVAVEYLEPPALQVEAKTGRIQVISQEYWSYSGPTTVYREAFEFIYDLQRAEGRWVITSYTFRNLRAPTVTPTWTPTRRPPPPTATPTG